jgi:hypothetical protein
LTPMFLIYMLTQQATRENIRQITHSASNNQG